jgi:hypothetical protein
MQFIRLAVALTLAGAAMSTPATAETLTNDTVVTLVRAGLGDEAVVAKIKGSANSFDLSTEQMIALKARGVSGPVIAAMIEASHAGAVSAKATLSADSPDPRVPHPSGIYLLSDWLPEPKMVRIDATTSNQTKTGGFLGYALTGGIASLSMKTVLPNAAARVRASRTRPDFYFYFDEANRSLSQGASNGLWLAGPAATVTSPNEFSLVRFEVKKDRREARVGSFNIAGAKTGVMDKDRISFSYEQVSPGVYRVTPSTDLQPGEYGFLYSMSALSGPGMFGGGVMTARIFDFSIAEGAQPSGTPVG